MTYHSRIRRGTNEQESSEVGRCTSQVELSVDRRGYPDCSDGFAFEIRKEKHFEPWNYATLFSNMG